MLDYAYCARGQLGRLLRFSDVFIYKMQNKGGERGWYLVLGCGFKVSKKNSFERVEHAGCVRHINIRVCPVHIMANQLVYILSKNEGLIPDMLNGNRTW